MLAAGSKLVVATGNRGKLKEIEEILANHSFELVAQSDLGLSSVEETGTTFEENALLKARHAAAETGLPAIADDSGLCVDALGGAPGVYSARYAGDDASDDDNIDKLLKNLHSIEDTKRCAAFRCVAVLVMPGQEQEPLVAEGCWTGAIATARRGDGGFGYDPVFIDDSSGLSAAELNTEDKNARSHRGQAFDALAKKIATLTS